MVILEPARRRHIPCWPVVPPQQAPYAWTGRGVDGPLVRAHDVGPTSMLVVSGCSSGRPGPVRFRARCTRNIEYGGAYQDAPRNSVLCTLKLALCCGGGRAPRAYSRKASTSRPHPTINPIHALFPTALGIEFGIDRSLARPPQKTDMWVPSHATGPAARHMFPPCVLHVRPNVLLLCRVSISTGWGEL